MNGWLKGWIKEERIWKMKIKKNIGCTWIAFMAVIFLSPLIILMQTASIDSDLDYISYKQIEIEKMIQEIRQSIENDSIPIKER